MRVDVKNSRFPVITDICWVENGYAATQEIANIYLGGRQVKQHATVKLKAIFSTAVEVADFMEVWHQLLNEGVKTFIIDATIFGKKDMFGIEQISPLVHNITGDTNNITFNATVLFDSSSIDNHVPVVESFTVHLEENSKDNFIILKGHDQDKELIDFEVGVGTAFGTLVGTPPNLLYTPDPSFKGIDCFNYTGRDYWGVSKSGVITIIVDDSLKPDSVFEYVVNNPIRAVGNIHYDLGDGIWTRSNGGLLVPKMDTIKIASLDHVIDTRDKQYVMSVNVLNWGSRGNYENFISDMPNLQSFSVDPGSYACKAQTLKNFATSTPITSLPLFQTQLVTDWTEFLMNSKVHSLPEFNFLSATTLYRAFRESDIAFIGVMNTDGCTNFAEMLMHTPKFSCLGGIDTTDSINNHAMFDGCGGNRPAANYRIAIEKGVKFAEPGGCGFTLGGITETTPGTCHVTKPGVACTASNGKYKAVVTNMPASGGLTYAWHSATAGVTLSNETTDEVSVSMPINAKELSIALVCDITSTNATKSVSGIFKIKQTYDALIIDLPKSYGRINLATFIAANNPSSLVNIQLNNRVVNCAIDTGDLTGLDVTLVNYSEIQGFRDGNKDALTITSPLKLLNKGIIRSAGKTGDKGTKGADDTYNKKVYTEKYTTAKCGLGGLNDSNWHDIVGNPGGLYAVIHWEGKRQNVQVPMKTGVAIAGIPGTFRRGKYKTKIHCSHPNNVYGIIHETTTPTTRTGGIGGLGGLGVGYAKPATVGQPGGSSTPTGGNSGAYGASGGAWGTGGNAINGVAKLTTGSVQGTLQGATV